MDFCGFIFSVLFLFLQTLWWVWSEAWIEQLARLCPKATKSAYNNMLWCYVRLNNNFFKVLLLSEVTELHSLEHNDSKHITEKQHLKVQYSS